MDAGVEQFGRLDIVCANAGIAPTAFREVSIEEDLDMWTAVIDVNLVGSFPHHQGRDPAPDRRRSG